MMTARVRREMEEMEVRARGAIADIIALLDRVPKEKLEGVTRHLEEALQAARPDTRHAHQKAAKEEA
jgi:hypothetical protein